jgi:hypothetical protein
VENCLWVILVLDHLAYPQNISTFSDIIINIIVSTFIGKLGHTNSISIIKQLKILYFSEANCSSKSYKSRPGGGSSLRVGGNTAACKAGIGVSNYGGINVIGSCLTPKVVNNLIVSGMRSVSNL